MHSPDKALAEELDGLATAITVALARIKTAAADPGHILQGENTLLGDVAATGAKLSTSIRQLAERLESACCDSVVFPNARCGIESVVRPTSRGYSVVLRDTDAGRTLPTVHRFLHRDEAIARAKHLVGVR